MEIAKEIRAFRRGLASAPEGEEIPVHLTDEDLNGFVWDSLDAEEREGVKMHLSGIRGCRLCITKIGEAMAARAIDDLMANAETRELIERRMKGGGIVL